MSHFHGKQAGSQFAHPKPYFLVHRTDHVLLALIADSSLGYLHQQSTWELQMLVSLPAVAISYPAEEIS